MAVRCIQNGQSHLLRVAHNWAQHQLETQEDIELVNQTLVNHVCLKPGTRGGNWLLTFGLVTCGRLIRLKSSPIELAGFHTTNAII